MKKFIFAFLFFLCLSFNMLIVPSIAEQKKIVKHGIYTLESLNLSPNTEYFIQNNSFNERIYVMIFDPTKNIIQTIRLWPQSQKFNLIPLENGYRIIVTGDGELVIS